MFKLLMLDIETMPNLATVWGIFKQNIHISQLLETSRVACFSARWYGSEEDIFYSEFHDGHKKTIKALHKLLSEADAVCHYNGNSFDMPLINREFLLYKMDPPSPYKNIDLLQTVRKNFRFVSNKLDHIVRELKIGEKIKHKGHQLWLDCMNKKKDAWEEMKEYNLKDTALLIELYNRLLPWIKDHPNLALYTDDDRVVCTNCGSPHVQKRGVTHTQVMSYQRLQCVSCGTWLRERVNCLTKEKKKTIVTQEK